MTAAATQAAGGPLLGDDGGNTDGGSDPCLELSSDCNDGGTDGGNTDGGNTDGGTDGANTDGGTYGGTDGGTDPTPTSTPDCPDGYLTRQYGSGLHQFGKGKISVPLGTTRKFCAKVDTPLLPSDFQLDRIYFTWYDETDYECGEVEVTVEQTFPPYLKRGPSRSTNGSHRFNRASHSGGYGSLKICEDCVKRGVYLITIKATQLYTPADPYCSMHGLVWGYN